MGPFDALFSKYKSETKKTAGQSSKEMRPIERPQPPDFFFVARQMAGYLLQQELKALPGAHWLKAEYTCPAFENLTFAYGNQIFCVLFCFIDEKTGESYSIGATKENLISTCEENNMIPCIFGVAVDDINNPSREKIRPLKQGWNLIHAKTGSAINPAVMGNPAPVRMSEWELHDFAVQVVRNHITEKLKLKILSYQTVIGVEPQIFFENEKGEKCWVIVRHVMYPEKRAGFLSVMYDLHPSLRKFKGYYASVGFSSMGEEPSILYRGEGANILFKGLESEAEALQK